MHAHLYRARNSHYLILGTHEQVIDPALAGLLSLSDDAVQALPVQSRQVRLQLRHI